MTADGIIAFHISNGYLDLTPALGALARDANLVCWWQEHIPPKDSEGIFASQWVLMAHRPEDLGEVLKSGRWEEVKAAPGTPVWTDDFSNIFSALSWR